MIDKQMIEIDRHGTEPALSLPTETARHMAGYPVSSAALIPLENELAEAVRGISQRGSRWMAPNR